METIKEGEKEEYVYKRWWTRSRGGECCQGWIWFRVFPFVWDDSVCDVEKLLRPDQHEDMMLKQNQIFLTDLDFAVAQLFWVYFTVTYF